MELPEGWKLVKLGDIADILDKFRKPLNKDERENIKGNIPYCGANGIIDYINDYIFDGEYLLVAEDGGFFKKFERSSYIFKGKFWANNHVHVLQIKKEFSLNKYVHYFLYFEDLEKYCSGATRLKLNQKMLKNLLIPIPYKDNKPDLQKQKEIVNKIETLFNNINKAIELRQKAINETKDLFNSVLNNVFKDEGFELVRLGDVGKYINGRAFKPSEWEETGLPIIRIQNLNNPNAPYNYCSKPVEKKYYIQNGDLLISWSASIDAYIWSGGKALLNQHIFKVELKNEYIDKKYMYFAIKPILKSIMDKTHGSTMKHITKKKFEYGL